MIKDVIIGNLKGIKSCKIEDLGQINLFIGKNNSCKSTILEAIYYGLREFSYKPDLIKILQHRTNSYSGGQELWFNYDIDKPIAVIYSFDKSVLSLRLDFVEDTNEIVYSLTAFNKVNNSTVELTGSRYSSSSLGITYSVVLNKFNPDEHLPPKVLKYVKNLFYLENLQRTQVNESKSLIGYLKNYGLSKEFGKYLHRIYGIGDKWAFSQSLDNAQEFRPAAMIDEKPYFLSGLGDGIRFAVPMLAAAIIKSESAILVEEIECNQHPAALQGLLFALVELCVKNKLQLFLTTHSRQVSEIIYYDIFDEKPKERERDFHCYFVDRAPDTGVVKCERVREEEDKDWRKVNDALFN